MKKRLASVLAVLLALAFCLSLAACGEPEVNGVKLTGTTWTRSVHESDENRETFTLTFNSYGSYEQKEEWNIFGEEGSKTLTGSWKLDGDTMHMEDTVYTWADSITDKMIEDDSINSVDNSNRALWYVSEKYLVFYTPTYLKIYKAG